MKIVKSTYDQTTMSSNAEMEAEKAPTTFLSLPAELRNEIYKLSGYLEVRQGDEVTSDGRCPIPDYHGDIDHCPLCSGCSQDRSQCLLCFELSESGKELSLWVNRNSNYTITGLKADGGKKWSVRHKYVSHLSYRNETAVKHGHHIKNRVEQPALTKVSKEVRNDTLPIFYGSHSFLLTLFDRDADIASIFKWFRKIGKENAALLREVKIVVRTKGDKKYAQTELKRALKKRGLNADGGTIVKVVKLRYPFCYCEYCVRNAIGEV